MHLPDTDVVQFLAPDGDNAKQIGIIPLISHRYRLNPTKLFTIKAQLGYCTLISFFKSADRYGTTQPASHHHVSYPVGAAGKYPWSCRHGIRPVRSRWFTFLLTAPPPINTDANNTLITDVITGEVPQPVRSQLPYLHASTVQEKKSLQTQNACSATGSDYQLRRFPSRIRSERRGTSTTITPWFSKSITPRDDVWCFSASLQAHNGRPFVSVKPVLHGG